jgi:hypothetical protein
MRFIVAILFTGLISVSCGAQSVITGINKLSAEFGRKYDTVKTATDADFFELLTEVSAAVFTARNKDFVSLLYTTKKEKGGDLHDAAAWIFDTVMYQFTRKYLWNEEDKASVQKFKPVLVIVNKALCECMQPKSNNDEETYEILLERMRTCGTELIKDTSYVNNIRRNGANVTMADLPVLGRLGTEYAFVNCPLLFTKLSEPMKDVSAYRTANDLTDIIYDADKEMAQLYTNKNLEDLKARFPLYQQYEKDLKAVDMVLKTAPFFNQENNKTNALRPFTITKTYYAFDKAGKAVLKGQLAYSVSEEAADAKILSFRFVRPQDIANKASLLKKLNEFEMLQEVPMPPPPPPGWKEVKIDTTKKGNLR